MPGSGAGAGCGLIHVHRADRYGNAQIEGISGFAYEMARACKRVILSAEEIVDTDEIRKFPIAPSFRIIWSTRWCMLHSDHTRGDWHTFMGVMSRSARMGECRKTPEGTPRYLD